MRFISFWNSSSISILKKLRNHFLGTTLPSKHLLVLKTSLTRIQSNNFSCFKMFWSSLEDVFKKSSKTKSCYAEDVLKTSWGHFLKTSWRHVLKTSSRVVSKTSWRRVLKTSWRNVLKTSWRLFQTMSSRRLGDKQNVCWEYLYLKNLNLYLINLYLSYWYLTNQGESKMH